MSATLLVDDLRVFRDGRPAVLARTLASARAALLDAEALDELYLDFDLGEATGTREVAAGVLDVLAERDAGGKRLPVRLVTVHTSSPVGRAVLTTGLRRLGYAVRVVDAATLFVLDPSLAAYEDEDGGGRRDPASPDSRAPERPPERVNRPLAPGARAGAR